MLKFLVKNQKITAIEKEIIASKQIAFVKVKFVFDGDWKKFHKVVQFTQCDETYNCVLGFDGLSCLLPTELHVGSVKMSVFGYDADNTDGLRATTVPIVLNIRQSGFVGDGETPIPPTPDLYSQLIKRLEEKADGLQNGVDGASAYEIAVENGFEGTATEWLESLKGEKGDQGDNGLDGVNGHDGKSAYEIWLDAGNSGTDSDFLLSLKGEQGEQGIPGQKGDKGDIGEKGTDGFSPVASVTQTETGAVITITDVNGTTTANVKNGENSDDSGHTHSNKTVLDNITAEKIIEWDAIASKPGLKIILGGEIFGDYENNEATGKYSTAIGQNTAAYGDRSFAGCRGCIASGDSSVALGGECAARGDSAIALGGSCIASGEGSVALGGGCVATGYASAAIGAACTASKQNSIAIGGSCIASGDYSHAEGQNTKASSLNQHVQGKYNIEDTIGKYAFIIGNGDSENKRSNAFAIDWGGNIYVNNSETGVNVLELKKFLNVLGERTTTLETSNDNWGDYNPSHNNYPLACETHYIESDKYSGKRTFAVVIRNSSEENNAIRLSPNGLYVEDLSPQIQALETSIGDIQTVLASIVEVAE